MLGRLHVDAAGRGPPLMPAWPWLGDLPASRLLHLVTGPAARTRIAGTRPATFIERDSVLEVAVFCVPIAGRERAGEIADLDQVPEGIVRLVRMRFVSMVTLEGRHWL